MKEKQNWVDGLRSSARQCGRKGRQDWKGGGGRLIHAGPAHITPSCVCVCVDASRGWLFLLLTLVSVCPALACPVKIHQARPPLQVGEVVLFPRPVVSVR